MLVALCRSDSEQLDRHVRVLSSNKPPGSGLCLLDVIPMSGGDIVKQWTRALPSGDVKVRIVARL